MTAKLTRGYKALLDEANAEIETLGVEQAIALHAKGDADTVFVDIRDIRELKREGRIPGAVHAPRGMLEFWVDPESPYFKPVFGEAKRFVFFCAAGWRSALATKAVQDMGLTPVAHVEGGFGAWKTAGGPVDAPEASAGASADASPKTAQDGR
ncbi:rhodanese-like domain-containing protein [Stappia sp.]|uniref:rhodanese-like domain-containing protein n=1 Tax=Stappia sp. TaxID=1870903 RepID=UPI0032D98761